MVNFIPTFASVYVGEEEGTYASHFFIIMLNNSSSLADGVGIMRGVWLQNIRRR